MMSTLNRSAAALLLTCCFSFGATATVIEEILEAPSVPGNAWSGTFVVTPDETLWAFGVGTSKAQDTSVSGTILGQRSSRHWVPRLISRDSWDNGVNWEAARPIGSSSPSDFSFNTSSSNWEWGSSTDVAFYFLYESGSPALTLNTGLSYDNFRFFTDGPESTFATYAENGTVLETGETRVTITGGTTPVPEPTTAALMALGLLSAGYSRRRRTHRSIRND